jgi:hypothetical protein
LINYCIDIYLKMMISSRAQTLSKKLVTTANRRAQSTSTMGLLSSTQEQTSSPTPIKGGELVSTMQMKEKKNNFSTAVAENNDDRYYTLQDQLELSLKVFELNSVLAEKQEGSSPAIGFAMDYNQAADAVQEDVFDKVLLLMTHGEAILQDDVDLDQAEDSFVSTKALSPKGIGQTLDLSRAASTYCHRDTGLVPELCVVSPLPCAAEAALMTFPHYSPDSVGGIPWISHDGCMDHQDGQDVYIQKPVRDLENKYRGIDYSAVTITESTASTTIESEEELKNRTMEFLQWLNERPEKVVVISSHPKWMKCLSSLLVDTEEPIITGDGEMQPVGIKFL